MDAWYTPRHHTHHGHGELIGGELLSGFELPVRAERVRDARRQHGAGPYLAALAVAIAALTAKRCGAVIVSLSVDTFERDPISRLKLTTGMSSSPHGRR